MMMGKRPEQAQDRLPGRAPLLIVSVRRASAGK